MDSITNGRTVLREAGSHPSLQEMRTTADKTLSELNFSQCTLFELYWLCCVFSDYDTADGFKFDELVLPDWFPLPFGFENEEYLYLDKKALNLMGGRICPPQVWDEAEVKFWRENNPLTRTTGEPMEWIPNKDWVVVLPPDHPVRQHISHGRPRKPLPSGEVLMPHKAMRKITNADDFEMAKTSPVPKAPKECDHCGGTSLVWDNDDKGYKCILCCRVTAPVTTDHPPPSQS